MTIVLPQVREYLTSFFVNINLLDEGSENFRCELFNVDILFSLRYELFDVFILQIKFIDFPV